MTDTQYKKPPIVEAVVEFKFSTNADDKKYSKALTRLKSVYDGHKQDTLSTYIVDLNASQRGPQRTDQIVDTLFSNDMSQRAVLRSNSFIVSKLAPYTCWDEFKERIMRDIEIWRSTVGYQPLERIGLRYVNRIDLPLINNHIQVGEYVSIYSQVPGCFQPVDKYSINFHSQLPDIGAAVIVNSAMVESPLAQHYALVLDFDIYRVFNSPASDDEISNYLDQARLKKNELFESSITDKTRELFNRE